MSSISHDIFQVSIFEQVLKFKEHGKNLLCSFLLSTTEQDTLFRKVSVNFEEHGWI